MRVPRDGRSCSIRTASRDFTRRIDRRGNRNTILAIWLSAVMVVSVFFVPAAGATQPSDTTIDPDSFDTVDSPGFYTSPKKGNGGGNGNGKGNSGNPNDGDAEKGNDGSNGNGNSNSGSSDGSDNDRGGSDNASDGTGSANDKGNNDADKQSGDSGDDAGSDGSGGSGNSDDSGNSGNPNDGKDGDPNDGDAEKGNDQSNNGDADNSNSNSDPGNSDNSNSNSGNGNSHDGKDSSGNADGKADDDGDDGPSENADGNANEGRDDADDGNDNGQGSERSDEKADDNADDAGSDEGEGEDTSGDADDGGNDDGSGESGDGPTVEVSVDESDDDAGASDAPGESDDGDEGDREDEDEDGETSTVNVEVSDVEEGQRVSVDVSTDETEDDEAAFDSIETEVKKGGSFTMTITTSRDPLPGSPEFETDDGADSIARIRLDHSISNDDVGDVRFTFRVSRERLRAIDTDPENVVLYRYSDGSWTALPTKPIGETDTHYVFSAESPGMSEFAVGAQRPKFDLWHAAANARSVTDSETVEFRGRVTNVGGADGTFTAELAVDGRVVERKRLTVASGGTRQATFHWTFDRPGEYAVTINGRPAGTVTVEPAGTTGVPSRSGSLLPDPSRWSDGISVDSLFEWVAGIGRGVNTASVPVPVSVLT